MSDPTPENRPKPNLMPQHRPGPPPTQGPPPRPPQPQASLRPEQGTVPQRRRDAGPAARPSDAGAKGQANHRHARVAVPLDRLDQASNAGWVFRQGLVHHPSDQAADDRPKKEDPDGHPHVGLVSQVTKVPVPSDVYLPAFTNWRDMVTSIGATQMFRADTAGALAVGLGGRAPIDVGFTLHHTYGVPYLPGSALKGLARRAAECFVLNDEQTSLLFGDDAEAGSKAGGFITFWDGWMDPGTVRPLQNDVITVHHSVYYASANTYLRAKQKVGAAPGKAQKHDLEAMRTTAAEIKPPTDFDDPNPVSFLSVRPGVTFHIAVTCNAEPSPEATAWATVAATILRHGLVNLGFGGKTNSGYGLFRLADADDEPRR